MKNRTWWLLLGITVLLNLGGIFYPPLFLIGLPMLAIMLLIAFANWLQYRNMKREAVKNFQSAWKASEHQVIEKDAVPYPDHLPK